MNDRGFSLTIRELYEFKHFHNVKLTAVINRIPTMIEYVLHEQLDHKEAEKKPVTISDDVIHSRYYEGHELAA